MRNNVKNTVEMPSYYIYFTVRSISRQCIAWWIWIDIQCSFVKHIWDFQTSIKIIALHFLYPIYQDFIRMFLLSMLS